MTEDIFVGTPSYSEAFRAVDITSQRMKDAIKDWVNLYYQNSNTDNADVCQQIPYTIVRKMTKTVFSEYKAVSEDSFADALLQALCDISEEALQMALISGESLLKPVPTTGGFFFTVVPRQNIRVFGRDATGRLTDIGTDEKSTQDKFYYTLLERRTVDASGYLTIRNYLYRSLNEGDLGTRVSLQSIPRYAALEDEYTYPNPIGSVGLISLRTPMVNNIDGSKDAVSVYAAAVGLIRNINHNEALLNGEFDRGESRIIASRDLLKKRPTNAGGTTTRESSYQFRSNLFAGLDGDPSELGINIFSPALREASFLARKQEYLRNIENVIGLKRGLLSEVEAAERTATEITSSAGEYNLTIIDFQRQWEKSVREMMRVCPILGQAHGVAGAHEVSEEQYTINWGNGILYDEAKTDQELRSQVQQGLLQPERYLGWYYNRPCETPEERAQIRKAYMPETLVEGE